MVSLTEELEARAEAARSRVEELQERIAELSERLEAARSDLTRWSIAREAVAVVMAERSDVRDPVVAPSPSPESKPRVVVGAIMVPHWREGLSAGVLPDVYQDIVEVIADAPGPVQAKQIVPRIGLPAVSAKIEGTRGKLKRLVERGWLREDQPGLFALAHPLVVEKAELPEG